MFYVSVGEPTAENPLPDPFVFAGTPDLRRTRTLRESAMVGPGALNRCLGDSDGNNIIPLDKRAVEKLAGICAARGMPVTFDAEGEHFGWDSQRWIDDRPGCIAAMYHVAEVLALFKAYQPNVPRYVFNGTPGKLSNPDHRAKIYPGFADFEAGLFAPLVSGPNIDNYKRVQNPLVHWIAESDFYLAEGKARYKGTGKLVFRPAELDEGGITRVGYVGNDFMDAVANYASDRGMHLEIWGVSHSTLGPEPEAWDWLRKRKRR